MSETTTWRELCRCETALEARRIATSIAAMEFLVQLVDARTGAILTEQSAPPAGPVLVQVSDEDWTDLADVLDEIIDEQADFDVLAEHREHRQRRWLRLAFAVLVTLIVAVFLARWLG